MAETSTKPYLIRAIYEWCNDNGYTPYLAVAVDERTQVPQEHVKAGEIVLNVSPMATHRLELGNELISFQARFAGVARELSIPVENVSAIYARENGHGMAFDVPRALAVAEPAPDAAGAPTGPRAVVLEAVAPSDPVPQSPAGSPDGGPPAPPPEDGAPRGGRPRLTRVK
jgi:stringent starvation protein B